MRYYNSAAKWAVRIFLALAAVAGGESISGKGALAQVFDYERLTPIVVFQDERRNTGVYKTWDEACTAALGNAVYWEGWIKFDWTLIGGAYESGSPGCRYHLLEIDFNPYTGPKTLFNGEIFEQNWTRPRISCATNYNLNEYISPIACQRARFIGTDASCPAASGAISLGQGAVTRREPDFEYSLAGQTVTFERYYSSHEINPSSQQLGFGWSIAGFESKIVNEPSSATTVYVVQSPTEKIKFTQPNGSAWYSNPAGPYTLSSSSGVWTFTDTRSADVKQFNSQGALTQITYGGTRPVTLTYSDSNTPPSIAPRAGLLIGVSDSLGKAISMVYQQDGMISTITDPAGATTQFEYAGLNTGLLTGITFPDGSTRSYSYLYPPLQTDAEKLSLLVPGRTATQTEVANLPTVVNSPRSYFLLGYSATPMLTLTNELGAVQMSNTVDTNGRAVSTQGIGGEGPSQVSYTSGPLSQTQTTTVTDARGAQRTYNFGNMASRSVMTSASQPAGSGCAAASAVKNYDSYYGYVNYDVDFSGRRTCYYYDPSRALETARVEGITGTSCSSTAAYGTEQRKITTYWHSDWAKKTKIAEPKRITTLVYNGQVYNGSTLTCAPTSALVNGKPIPVLCRRIEQATTDENGNQGMGATTVGTAMQWDYTYDKYGQILTVNGPRTDVSDVTTFAYYADNDTDVNKRAQLASVTNALGQITQYAAYNGYGQPLTIVDPNGVTTTRTYDARRRLLTEQTAGETTQYTYDAAGKLTRVTLPDATWVGYAYDTAGRLTQVQDSAGNRIEYTLDAAGNRTTEDTKDPSGSLRRRITRVYDALNRVQNVTGGL